MDETSGPSFETPFDPMTGRPNLNYVATSSTASSARVPEPPRPDVAEGADGDLAKGARDAKVHRRRNLLIGAAALVVIAVTFILVLRPRATASSISQGDNVVCNMASKITHPINEYITDLHMDDFMSIAAQATDGTIAKFAADVERQADSKAATPDLNSIVDRCQTLGYPPPDPNTDGFWATEYAADVVRDSTADVLQAARSGDLGNTWVDSKDGLFICAARVFEAASKNAIVSSTGRTTNFDHLPTYEEMSAAKLAYDESKSAVGNRVYNVLISTSSGNDLHGVLAASTGSRTRSTETFVIITGIDLYDSSGKFACS